MPDRKVSSRNELLRKPRVLIGRFARAKKTGAFAGAGSESNN
jgi:hypothetical protein